MKNQSQYLTETVCNELLKLLQKFEELFDSTFRNWKTDPLDLDLKYNVKPVFSRPCTVLNVQEEMFKNRLSA